MEIDVLKVNLSSAYRCGTTFARTAAEGVTTPIWRRTEAAPSGTTRKRWTEIGSPLQQRRCRAELRFLYLRCKRWTALCPWNCSSYLTLRSTWSAPSPSVNQTLKYPLMSLTERSPTVSAERWEVGVRSSPPHTQPRQQNACGWFL